MPIQISTYKSRVNAGRVLPVSRTPSVQGVSNLGTTGLGRAVQVGVESAKNVARVAFKKEVELNEQQQAADILSAANSYHLETRKFEQDYMAANQEDAARNATADYQAFHEEKTREYAGRFSGNVKQSLIWEKQAGQIKTSSISRGMSYSAQQDEVYRDNITKTREQTYLQKVAEAPDDQSVDNLRTMFNAEVAALNSPAKTARIMAETDQKTAETRIRTAIAQKDVTKAQRLLSEYREARVLGTKTDEMIKVVEDARVNDEAYNISLKIIDEMPEATKTAKLEKARELAGDDAEVYKQARYQVIQDHSDTLAQQKTMDDSVTDMFDSKIVEAKTPVEREQIRQEILNTPMRAPVRTKLLTRVSQGLKQPLTSDEDTLGKVEDLVAREAITPEQLEREYKWSLAPSDYNRQKDRLEKVGGNRVAAYNIGMEDRLTIAFAEDPKSKRKPQTKRFKGMMDQYIDEYYTENNRYPSDKELRDQEDWLLKEVVYNEQPSFWPDKKIERFLLDTLELKDFDVPDAFVPDIKKSLEAAGVQPTEEEIAKVYRAYLQDRRN